MDITFIWNTLLIHPILNVLVAFYKLFFSIGLPGSLGFAIIALTLLIRLLLYPFTQVQLRSAKQMQNLKPHLDRIKELHGKDKVRHQQEMAKLYKEHGVNPAAGCLPLVIQLPIFIALYNVLQQVVANGDVAKITDNINKIVYFPLLKIDGPWDPHFFVLNLSQTPSHWQTGGVILLAVPVVTALLQFAQTKMMMPQAAQVTPVKIEKEKQDDGPDMAGMMQKQMLYFSPVMFGFISWNLPVGLALYWNAFSIFGIIQQYVINREKEHGRDTKH